MLRALRDILTTGNGNNKMFLDSEEMWQLLIFHRITLSHTKTLFIVFSLLLTLRLLDKPLAELA